MYLFSLKRNNLEQVLLNYLDTFRFSDTPSILHFITVYRFGQFLFSFLTG